MVARTRKIFEIWPPRPPAPARFLKFGPRDRPRPQGRAGACGRHPIFQKNLSKMYTKIYLRTEIFRNIFNQKFFSNLKIIPFFFLNYVVLSRESIF
jgi:hypothetical protein